MGAATVIDANLLALAGISAGALADALTGKTIAEAAALYIDVLRLAIGAAQIARRGMVTYNVEGQAVTTSMDDAQKALRFLQQMAQTNSGGPISLPAGFI